MSEAEHGPDTPREGIADLDTSRAHPARVYDYWLGGTDNFPADREAAERVLAAAPGLRWRVRANRAFLGRAVYVDNDPIVLRHAQALLRGAPPGATGYLQADLRDPGAILDRAA